MPLFAELGALSNFTFLEGASHPHELAEQARAFGMPAFGIADRNSVAGLVRGLAAAEQTKIRFVPGIRLCLDGGAEYLAWPGDLAAWGRLCRMLSAARMQGGKDETRLTWEMLRDHCEGSVLARLPPRSPDQDFARSLRADARDLRNLALPLFCAVDHRCRGDDEARLDALAAIGVPLIAAGGVRYHHPARRRLADVVTAIRLRTTIDQLGRHAEPNAEAHLLPPDEAARRLQRFPEAIEATDRVTRACTFSLRDLSYQYPAEILDPGRTAQQTLEARIAAACLERWPQGVPPKIADKIAHELRLIAKLDYAAYFLTVHEIVRFAQSRAILCQGRGSAANSVVCYILGITAVPPDKHDMLFERFLSEARGEPPDIDVDFEHERREEVIQHIYARYGRDRAAIAATLIRYRDRSAIREVAKAMGLPEEPAIRIAKAVWGAEDKPLTAIAAEQGLDPADPRIGQAMELAEAIQGFPRHLATHVGGFVITRGKLVEHTVVVKAAMEDRTTLEWDKDDIETLRMLKVDVLGLGMLSCIRRAFALIAATTGRALTLQAVPEDDAETYAMLRRADSVGVFQVESRAQMSMLPRLRPREFYDLVIQVAIVRPGPIQGDMVHPYLRRRNGEEAVAYPSDELRAVLERTLGVPLFQEQAMKIAIVGAGFSPARADQLRKAMATFKSTGKVERFRAEFIAGMTGRGYSADFAERCFRQIEGFGNYGFPESHAASFAKLVYISAWIKCHHPAVFAAALINSQPMGFYAPAQIVRDAKEHGVAVRPADVTVSGWDCAVEVEPRQPALRLGLRVVSGLSAEAGAAIEHARTEAPFRDIPDLVHRARLDRAAMQALSRADALRSLAATRRHALWEAAGIEKPLPLSNPRDDAAPLLPKETAGEETVLDYAATGLSLRRHPLALLRPRLLALRAADTRALATARKGRWMRIPGLVLVRQRPGSAKGVVFFTIEDEWGVANLVLYTDIIARDRAAVVNAKLVMAEGPVERTENTEVPIIHLITRRLHDWSHLLEGLHALEDPAAWDRALARADEVRHATGDDPRTVKRAQAAIPPSRDFR